MIFSQSIKDSRAAESGKSQSDADLHGMTDGLACYGDPIEFLICSEMAPALAPGG
jgi:hypothetical protein